MKTTVQLKLIALLGFLYLALASCGSSTARPASGFDMSVLSPILSIGPKISDGSAAPVAGDRALHRNETLNPAAPANPNGGASEKAESTINN
ncbi:MAG: hypothetical protein IPK76_06210 [Lewinellaceae bacterium]|jgi:hypothetical protein|nr:hypothetical protein [Lewinellaceae bacterium]